jgi:amino acid transporter
VLPADALSWVAYGPQAMLAVLVLAGLPGLSYSLPAGPAIALLMLAVGVSCRQTIRACPQGGGSYIVASEKLGRAPGPDATLTHAYGATSGLRGIPGAAPQGGVSGSGCAFVGLLRCEARCQTDPRRSPEEQGWLARWLRRWWRR